MPRNSLERAINGTGAELAAPDVHYDDMPAMRSATAREYRDVMAGATNIRGEFEESQNGHSVSVTILDTGDNQMNQLSLLRKVVAYVPKADAQRALRYVMNEVNERIA